MRSTGGEHLVLDVREARELDICQLVHRTVRLNCGGLNEAAIAAEAGAAG